MASPHAVHSAQEAEHQRAAPDAERASADRSPQQAPALAFQRTIGNRALAALVPRLGVQRLDDGPTAEAEPEAGAPEDVGADRPMIRFGSRGPAVIEAQVRLNAAGAAPALAPLVPDGIFGPLTLGATRTFQTANGLVPDGIIGPLTWAALLAVVPPGGPPLFSLGSTGEEVGLLEQRLNAAGMADPFLPIDATYDLAVLVAVARFQFEEMGAIPTGAVDQATWDALAQAAPGGEVDATGVATHVPSVEPEPRGEQVEGTSLHMVVGPPAGLTEGPAVEEFQQKLNVVRAAAGLEPIAVNGFWNDLTRDATQAYQSSVGLAPTGIGDLPTWARLDQDAPVTTVGFVERQWTQQQGGLETGMTAAGGGGSRYSWRILPNQILVTVKVDFRNNPPSPDWFGHVPTAWNRFKAVSDSGDEVAINFEMVQGTGGDANVVDVKTGTGRANAGEWFLGDTDAANTIPHEYGHLIGLRDEYQVHPGDYREITGNEPPVGATAEPADGATPLQIANELQDAMITRNDTAAKAATIDRGIQMGAFAQRIVGAYAGLPAVVVPAKGPPKPKPSFTTSRTDIASDLFRALDKSYEIIQVLTYSTGSMMGDPSRVTDPHDHGVRPRHVREFVDLVAAARGGTWEVQAR
ncbi:MAG: peptidoglycan-binding protein [Ilumatobacter sp.]|uniref:peptidoglycan-binding domain-containing protein n=1 Tax=Ilumatobacter sp. TaxID=1967498 RepID=UPI00262E6B1D|nr:peptidoglycan-binding protein [Ilumatobacter sp.]MDJ0771511.1 peptidoglycan-binding protein [Ilumatobacter sp.]